MNDDTQDNGMTEIALALAMGFFSLMILTLISMGAGVQSPTDAQAPATLALQRALSEGASPGTAPTAPDLILFHHQGRYLGADMKPTNPAQAIARARAGNPATRIILAVDPDLSFGDGLPDPDGLVVTAYSNEWRQRLRQGGIE
jgi:hypothetical protein